MAQKQWPKRATPNRVHQASDTLEARIAELISVADKLVSQMQALNRIGQGVREGLQQTVSVHGARSLQSAA